MCRVAPDVLKKTSSVGECILESVLIIAADLNSDPVTEILLVSGILSALTAAWWGGVSDRRGRRVVLATTSFADMVTNAMMLA